MHFAFNLNQAVAQQLNTSTSKATQASTHMQTQTRISNSNKWQQVPFWGRFRIQSTLNFAAISFTCQIMCANLPKMQTRRQNCCKSCHKTFWQCESSCLTYSLYLAFALSHSRFGCRQVLHYCCSLKVFGNSLWDYTVDSLLLLISLLLLSLSHSHSLSLPLPLPPPYLIATTSWWCWHISWQINCAKALQWKLLSQRCVCAMWAIE